MLVSLFPIMSNEFRDSMYHDLEILYGGCVLIVLVLRWK